MTIPYKWFALFIAILVTIALCLWPNFHPEQAVLKQYYWQTDVLIHGGYYLFLTIFIRFLNFKQKPLTVFLLIGALSFSLEMLQFFIPKRGVSLLDVGSNFLGIGAGLFLMRFIAIKQGAKRPT